MSQKIAVVEDDGSIRDMYRTKFEAEGFEVFTAENGAKGLELIKEHKPDVILLDIMMPEMTGDEMLHKLRGTDWGRGIKVIIMTNVSQEEALKKVRELGVSDFVIKAQSTPHQVLEVVRKVLSH
jgi:DNA-binding response OmpR family regulator